MSVYDGLDAGFLKVWLVQGQSQVRTALRKSAGEVHYKFCRSSGPWEQCRVEVNPYVEKVGIADHKITRWDPAEFSHGVPTLILKGGADPVSAGDAGDHIYSEALRGPRTLIKFPGIGHAVPDLELPLVWRTAPIDTKGPCKGTKHTFNETFSHVAKDCLVASFVKMEFDEFKNAPILEGIKTTFRTTLDKMEPGLDYRVDIFHCPPECAPDSFAK